MTDEIKLPPLPKPDTHCFDEDRATDVWSHSPAQMQDYASAAVEAYRAQRVPDWSHPKVQALADRLSEMANCEANETADAMNAAALGLVELIAAHEDAQGEIRALRNAAWKLGDALQDEQKKATKLQAEIIRLRCLMRDLVRTTSAHHQSPGDMPIQAAYVAARDAAVAALNTENTNG